MYMDDYGDSINSSQKPKELQKEKIIQKQLEIAWKALEMMERFPSFRESGKYFVNFLERFQNYGKGFASGKKDAKVLECQERFK